jgi:hypothetical protein
MRTLIVLSTVLFLSPSISWSQVKPLSTTNAIEFLLKNLSKFDLHVEQFSSGARTLSGAIAEALSQTGGNVSIAQGCVFEGNTSNETCVIVVTSRAGSGRGSSYEFSYTKIKDIVTSQKVRLLIAE